MRTFKEQQSRGKPNTSWGGVTRWYSDLVGESGHFFHQKLILPKVLKILDLKPDDSLLDLGCGEGVLERAIPEEVDYLGVDVADALIREANKKSKSGKHHFKIVNLSRPFKTPKLFKNAICILSMQNMADGKQCVVNAASSLQKDGKFVIVLNHPAFRIPRQSSWETDEKNKLQFRRVNRYFSSLEIPIQMNPGQGREQAREHRREPQRDQGKTTWSYHNPISTYFAWLKEAGFMVHDCQEWVSEKESVGSAAKMENRARSEFPMFMCIIARRM